MNFNNIIVWTARAYKLLEKLKFENALSLDYIIDTKYPEILSRLQANVLESKVAICATNGKKTVANLLNQILEAKNKTFITNITKSAKKYPILTSILLDISREIENYGSFSKKDFYIMALEEAELAGYFNSMKFDALLLHNLFLNQTNLSTLEENKKRIQDAIVLNSKLDLIINADEPMFFDIDEIKNDTIINKKRKKIFYGFRNIEIEDNIELAQDNDIYRCPICGCKLDYKKRFYSHLGQYDCECGFKRPKLDIYADAKIYSDYVFLTVFWENNKYVFKLPFGGVYNAYNALASIILALYLKIDRKTISFALENYKNIKGRDEIIEYKKRKIKFKVIKNPTSLSECTRQLYGAKNVKLVFILQDKIEDGIDTSWIWNSNLEALKNFENKVFVCGNRFDDMALRLKYAGINPCFIVMDPSIKSAIECCFFELENNEEMLILTVPSALDEANSVLGNKILQ